MTNCFPKYFLRKLIHFCVIVKAIISIFRWDGRLENCQDLGGNYMGDDPIMRNFAVRKELIVFRACNL